MAKMSQQLWQMITKHPGDEIRLVFASKVGKYDEFSHNNCTFGLPILAHIYARERDKYTSYLRLA